AGHVYDPKAAKSAGEIRLWDVTAAEVKKTLHGKAHSYSLRAGCLALSPDGKLLAAAGWRRDDDKTPPHYLVEVWDLTGEKIAASLTGHSRPITWVAFAPDGKTLASASIDGTVIVCDPISARELLTLNVPAGVWPVAFAPDGKTLAS